MQYVMILFLSIYSVLHVNREINCVSVFLSTKFSNIANFVGPFSKRNKNLDHVSSSLNNCAISRLYMARPANMVPRTVAKTPGINPI